MGTSKNHFELKGKSAENLVHEMALETFLADWCYMNPLLPNGKELCDLLVVFDQVAIICQIKDLKLDANGRYRKAEVQKNLRQLSGARRRLFDLKSPIELTNPRRGTEVFDPSPITEIYLISILMGEGEDSFSFVESIRTYTAHVFTKDFTQNVLAELDTVADFTAYLRAKEAIVQRDKELMLMGGEEELLAVYLLNNRSFASFEEATDAIIVDEGSWQHLRDDPRYIAGKREDEISYGWDDIINRAHEGGANYEMIARELARPTRFQRRVLAKSFFDAHVMASKDDVNNVFRRIMSSGGVTYCFVFCEESWSIAAREAMLGATCYIARGRFQDNSKVVGIATEKRILPTCSYNLAFLEIPEWTSENQRKMETIQHQTGILVNPSPTQVHEEEYPS